MSEIQKWLAEDVTLCLDMGSFHLWIAHFLFSFRARQILISNGQQTLGVSLPWAIAACLVRPNEKTLSISGDGGFLFSAMELETAVRLKLTEAASEVVSNPAYLDAVLQKAPKNWEKLNLEAVIEANVIEGHPGPPTVVAVRTW